MMGRTGSALIALAIVVLPGSAWSQAAGAGAAAVAVPAPAEPDAIPIYGKDNPGRKADENWTRFMGRETVVRNITYPTLTPVLPDPAKATGAAVIVAPGGGFMMLSMENEGWRVARILADHGIAAFILKYRLVATPADDSKFVQAMAQVMGKAIQSKGGAADLQDPAATQDALAALKLIRGRSSDWKIDPDRVGMIGFSAGAMTAMRSVLSNSGQRGPDFVGYIYGPMAAVAVPPNAPPLFAALAMDDPLFGGGEFGVVTAWRSAKRPVELHAYERGGHGFGLGAAGTTNTLMMSEFIAWMEMRGYLKPRRAS